MKVKQDTYDVGVIIGRFEVPELHEAHLALFEHVISSHEKVIVFLGLSGAGQPTRNNPLDFEARKQMLLAEFPHVNVAFIRDIGDDHVWSRNLDGLIQSLTGPNESVILYGGRDSFVGHYDGKYPTRELEPDVWVSGTEIRNKVSKRVKASPDFRKGVVWAAYNRFPTAFTTVDVAILNEDRTKVLLGRKEHEERHRFIGGFATPNSPSFEHDAVREVLEETHLQILIVKYLGSFKIDDWRYRGEVDQIKTIFFQAQIIAGDPQPDDDIAELKWFELHDLRMEDVMSSHHVLLDRLLGEDLMVQMTPIDTR